MPFLEKGTPPCLGVRVAGWAGGGLLSCTGDPSPGSESGTEFPALRAPHPPVHREEEGEEEEELKALWPLCSVLLLFCVPGSPVSTLYLNYLSFL